MFITSFVGISSRNAGDNEECTGKYFQAFCSSSTTRFICDEQEIQRPNRGLLKSGHGNSDLSCDTEQPYEVMWTETIKHTVNTKSLCCIPPAHSLATNPLSSKGEFLGTKRLSISTSWIRTPLFAEEYNDINFIQNKFSVDTNTETPQSLWTCICFFFSLWFCGHHDVCKQDTFRSNTTCVGRKSTQATSSGGTRRIDSDQT